MLYYHPLFVEVHILLQEVLVLFVLLHQQMLLHALDILLKLLVNLNISYQQLHQSVQLVVQVLQHVHLILLLLLV